MNCPNCKAPMFEHCSYFACETPNCEQIPICKGCLKECKSTGAPIWEYFCNYSDCPRTPQDNLRDLLNPKFQRFKLVDYTRDKSQAALALERRMNNCFHCGTPLVPHDPLYDDQRLATNHKWCSNCNWVIFGTLLALLDDPNFERFSETQKSVHQWTSRMYPQYGTKERRAIAMIEEAVELGLAAGLSKEDILNVVNLPISKFEKTGDRGDDGEELADVLLCAYAYAEQTHHDAHAELDKKMRHNRSKPSEHFRAKYQKKLEQGLELRHSPTE